MNKENLLFYDIESFKHDALALFIDIEGNEYVFWNNRDRNGCTDLPSGFEGIHNLIKSKVLVGYNNYNYDDQMLTAMMNQQRSNAERLHLINNSIIGSNYKEDIHENIHSLDTMQQIDVSHPSLKQIEGNMGMSIRETTIPFDIQRPLTDDEREEVLEYCRHDVLATIEVFKEREYSYFDTKDGLLAMMLEDRSPNAYRWNTTTLSATILLGRGELHTWEHIPAGLKKYWNNVPGIPSEVWSMWENCIQPENILNKGKSKTIKTCGCSFVFGMGGLHGAPSKPGRWENVKHADVASMYPSAIVHLNVLENATDKYDQMRRDRVAIKKTDPVKAGALKLILNSVYGNLKNRYSKLFNPLASASVCIYGQIALFSLCYKLYNAGYEIINANTDGVVYDDNQELNGRDEEICREWEEEFDGFKLETDYFSEWIQKDVNNYIAVDPDGGVTVKGGDVNKYQVNKYFSNNSARIVQIALVEHLLSGRTKPVDVILWENIDNPLLWQYVLKAGNTYKGVVNREHEYQNKVNRIFACRADADVPHTHLYKERQDGGLVNFPDVPENMFVYNDDLEDLHDLKDFIDLDHYCSVVEQKLKGWP